MPEESRDSPNVSNVARGFSPDNTKKSPNTLRKCSVKRADFKNLLEEWKREEREPSDVWNESHVSGRIREEKPTWSYEETVREALSGCRALLDLATGDGEWLHRLKDFFPPRTAATGDYHPHLRMARERLEPLGVEIVESRDHIL